jgi:hypothetical protein
MKWNSLKKKKVKYWDDNDIGYDEKWEEDWTDDEKWDGDDEKWEEDWTDDDW